MKQYLDLLRHVRENGIYKSDRTGTGTYSVFGYQMKFDLSEGFPLVTTKKMFTKGMIHELLWFLAGDTNIKYLTDNGVHIWDEWATKDGSLGPVYGAMWRAWPDGNGGTVDQIANLIHEIKTNPDSRRLMVSGWNPALLPNTKISPAENAALGKQALPPCHHNFQVVINNGKLSLAFQMRSNDIFLGNPYNISSYALLTHMLAHVTGYEVGQLLYNGIDVHLYANHVEQADLQLSREPFPLPTLIIKRNVDSIFDFKYEDFEIINYKSHPTIKADIAV